MRNPEQPQRGRNLIGHFVSRLTKRPAIADTGSNLSPAKAVERVSTLIEQSDYISRDLSWLKFNERVLDQARNPNRTLMERLKFLAITDSNADEFFSIRVGSLYNYLDYHKERIDYSGLREGPFKKALFRAMQQFNHDQQSVFAEQLLPLFAENGLALVKYADLTEDEQTQAASYFDRTIFPTLTPMLYDYTHTFPVLLAKVLIFGVVTYTPVGDFRDLTPDDDSDNHRLSFVQIPANLPRFMTFDREEAVLFLPIEEIVRQHLSKLYRNVEISSVNMFRISRNGDFTLEENDDVEADFLDEIKQKIKNRRLGRVVRVEIEAGQIESPASSWMISLLKKRWEIDDSNLFEASSLIDFTSLWQIIRHPEFKNDMP
ncbi:MAG TPA: polyphosphate kinase 1, partial [Fibrella sp.]